MRCTSIIKSWYLLISSFLYILMIAFIIMEKFAIIMIIKKEKKRLKLRFIDD